MKLLTATEASERLGVHRTRVNVLIREGRLPAQRLGRAYMIRETDLKLVEDRKPGRPPKVKPEARPIGLKPKRATKKGGRK
jgi:excisionase family DNA binding protein